MLVMPNHFHCIIENIRRDECVSKMTTHDNNIGRNHRRRYGLVRNNNRKGIYVA
jgi:REP element-mobilizing transposase RayT